MEIDFCTDEMTKSQRSQYIFRFKKVVKEREVQRQSRYSFHLLRLLCVHQVCSEESKRHRAERSHCVCRSAENVASHKQENLAACTNRKLEIEMVPPIL